MVGFLTSRASLGQSPLRQFDVLSAQQFGGECLSQTMEEPENNGVHVLESLKSIFNIFMLVPG